MIEQLVYAMALGQVEQNQADLFMTHLCRVSNVSKAVFPDLVKIIYQCLADEVNQSTTSTFNGEQLQACKLLDIQPNSLTEQTLQIAYRKKMAEFHPDKYQNLPESVRQLIESQAQQLNEARAVLKAIWTITENKEFLLTYYPSEGSTKAPYILYFKVMI